MAKRRKIQQQQKQKSKPVLHQGHSSRAQARGHPRSNPKPGKPQARQETQKATHPRDLEPTIPFSPEDAILLVGEGDLSFSRALVEHHCCENVTATVLESSREELTAKYPHVQENADMIEAEAGKVLYGVDAKKMGPWLRRSGKESTGIFDRICTYTHYSYSSSSSSYSLSCANARASVQLPPRRRQEHRRQPPGPL